MKITQKENKKCCDSEKMLSRAELAELNRLVEAMEWDAYQQYRHINGGFAEAQMCNYDDDEIQLQLESGEQDTGSGYSSCYTETCTLPRKVLLDKKMSFKDKCKSFEFGD